MKRKFIQVENWKDLKEQFGIDLKPEGFKNAVQLSKELGILVNAGEFKSHYEIEYGKGEGIALFSYLATKPDGTLIYVYTRTAC